MRMQEDHCRHARETFDYTRIEPLTVKETAGWAVVYKPPHLPAAPLRADERNTLVYWFLHSAEPKGNVPSDDMQTEAQVRGKKAIEAGLLHRLDTDTRGLVLFAKNQCAYDFFSAQQEAGQIIKTYYAFVSPDTAETVAKTMRLLPYTVSSQFRNFGPGAKRAAPVVSGSRHYKKDGRLYTTVIEAADILPSPPLIRVRCRLSRGYRHQVRAHLAAAGLPIAGDPLYAPQGAEAAPVSLQLYAVSLAFPDPENPQRNILVALPPPDKMNP